jgi:Outer membrane protein beta-barrel domain
MRLRVGIVLSLLAATGAPACAQRGVELGPLVGYYRPMGDFAPSSVHGGGLPNTPQDLAGVLFGLDARTWLNERLGVEVQGALSSASIVMNNPGFGGSFSISDNVQMATAQLLARTSGNGHRFWIGAGPGVVRHAGDGYSQYGSPTNLAGAVSAGVEASLGRHLALTVGVNTLVYEMNIPTPADVRGTNDPLERGLQTDALLHLGLMWRIHSS